MAPKISIPSIKKENNMSEQKGIKGLVGRKMTKKVKFVGEDVTISKLSVAEVLEIQENAKKAETSEETGFDLLKRVIRMSVEDADQLSDEDFDTFPMDELSKLSTEIMKFSGIAGNETGK